MRAAVPFLAVAATSLAGCAALAGRSQVGVVEPTQAPNVSARAVLEGCAPVELLVSLPESDAFTPMDERLTGRPYLPLLAETSDAPSGTTEGSLEAEVPPVAPANLPLQATVQSGTEIGAEHVTLLYAATPVDPDETLPDFLGRGGVVVIQKPTGGAGAAMDVVEAVGVRALVAKVGIHDAALVPADPVGSGETRPYNLYWNDGERDWYVSGVVAPQDLVAFALLYCG